MRILTDDTRATQTLYRVDVETPFGPVQHITRASDRDEARAKCLRAHPNSRITMVAETTYQGRAE